ncbi:MAG: aminotransferase class V-fold PLP-dependent enzyme [Caldisericia bacterium]
MFKADFPSAKDVHNFDSAATGLLPNSVINGVTNYWQNSCSNAGRSAYFRSLEITDFIDNTRASVANYFGAEASELLFTPGATHSINWVAHGLDVSENDSILITKTDHHANILPWLNLQKKGIKIRWVNCNEFGRIDIDDFRDKIKGCKIAAFSGASNVSGAIQDIKTLVKIAKENGSLSLVDAATTRPTQKNIDFKNRAVILWRLLVIKSCLQRELGFSFPRAESQKRLNPCIIGGGGIEDIDGSDFSMREYPSGFESGTPSVEGIIGLFHAIKWYKDKKQDEVFSHEEKIRSKIQKHFADMGIETINPENSTPLVTFNIEGLRPHIIASKLDRLGNVLVRSGHMCAIPFTRTIRKQKAGFVRVSVGPWNDDNDVKALVGTIRKILDEN